VRHDKVHGDGYDDHGGDNHLVERIIDPSQGAPIQHPSSPHFGKPGALQPPLACTPRSKGDTLQLARSKQVPAQTFLGTPPAKLQQTSNKFHKLWLLLIVLPPPKISQRRPHNDFYFPPSVQFLAETLYHRKQILRFALKLMRHGQGSSPWDNATRTSLVSPRRCSMFDLQHRMFDLQHGQDDGILHITTRHVEAARAKWDRLSMADLSSIRTKSQLIERVEERYGLPHEDVVSDVELWASDKQF
jgi:hypothetical protein